MPRSEKEKTEIKSAMNAFISEWRDKGFHDEALFPMGAMISQKPVVKECGSVADAYLHFADLVKSGMSEQELLDKAVEMSRVLDD